MLTAKPKDQRVHESITLLKKFKTLGIPLTYAPVVALKAHLDAYIQEGVCWTGTIDFLEFGRVAEVVLPQDANGTIEVILKSVARIE